MSRQYTYGLQRISENQPINNTWTASFYGYDGGGSVRSLTNGAGAVMNGFHLEPFAADAGSTKLDVIVDYQHSIRGYLLHSPMLFHYLIASPHLQNFTRLNKS